MKSRLKEIQYGRFNEAIEERKNRIWTISKLLERINKVIPSNLGLTERGLRTLIGRQQKFNVFKCANNHKGKTTTYYIFKKCLPIENAI